MSDVERTIRDADLSEMSVYGGDCVNIAVALQAVFGGELVASYADGVDFRQSRPAHVTVRIDGELFDGGGRTSEEALRDRADYGVSDQDTEGIVVREIEQPSRRIHDPWRVNTVRRALERA